MATKTATTATTTYTNDLGENFDLLFKDVTYATNTENGQILLPEKMELSEAIWWLKTKQKDLETVITIRETIPGYPVDVAHAMGLAVQDMFGIRELRASGGFWGGNPPVFMSVPINAKGDTVEVFTGKFALPGIDGTIETGRVWNEELLVVSNIKQKCVPKLREFLALVRTKLREHSLYKGQAIRVGMTKESNMFEEKITMADPEFMDTSKMPAELVLNANTRELLTAGLWTPIERSEQTRFYGISLKRTVLLEGPYGTGKSLSALETARRATPAGWSFIYLNNVRDLKRVYPFAQRYAPAVMFAEDIDLIVKHEDDDDDNPDAVNMLNNVLDGIDSKTHDIILILTTNHANRLPESLMRVGRFDLVAHYERPDQIASVELVRQYAGNDVDEADFDIEVVGDLLAGNQPSTIHEIVKRAKLFAQSRFHPDYRGPLRLATRDIELSAQSMANHLRLLDKDETEFDSPAQQLGDMVGRHIEMGIERAFEGRYKANDFVANDPQKLVRPANKKLVHSGGD